MTKAGLSPIEIDMHGNTSVHHSSADEFGINILKCFLSQGVDIGLKNARGHSPLDLATYYKTRDLILKANHTKKCRGKKCNGSKFDFQNIRYYCDTCHEFYCTLCCSRSWVFENHESEERERPLCQCLNCSSRYSTAAEELQQAIEAHEFYTLHRVLTGILSD